MIGCVAAKADFSKPLSVSRSDDLARWCSQNQCGATW